MNNQNLVIYDLSKHLNEKEYKKVLDYVEQYGATHSEKESNTTFLKAISKRIRLKILLTQKIMSKKTTLKRITIIAK